MHAAVSPHVRSAEVSQIRLGAQDEISCILREHLHDLRISRNAWRTYAEAARHVLIDGARADPCAWRSTVEKTKGLFKHIGLIIFLLLAASQLPISHENVKTTLRCVLPPMQLTLPAEKTETPKLGFVWSSVSAEDRDYLIRTIAFEASGESEEGKAAVAHVILTRTRSGRWGDTIKAVVTHPWQFESWMTRREEIESLGVDDYRYRSAAQIADAVLAGQMADPTTGATHFLNPTIVKQSRSGALPAWAAGAGLSIGRHTFYAPEVAAWAATIARPSLTSCWPLVSLLPN